MRRILAWLTFAASLPSESLTQAVPVQGNISKVDGRKKTSVVAGVGHIKVAGQDARRVP